MSEDFLAAMARHSAARVAAAQAREPLADLRRRAAETPPPPALALASVGFDVIAEIKLRSPALGALAGDEPRDVHRDVAERALRYARGGACAISVLTEPSRFDGALSHLHAAAAAVQALDVPVMRKDFLVDPYQVFEARAAGAGGVLLITRMLSDAQLVEMLDAATEAGLFALVEAFDAPDLARGNALLARLPSPPLLGINTRDLTTLQIDSARLRTHAGEFAAGCLPVAESGVASVADCADAARMGYRVALIGTALMQAAEPAALLAQMLVSGRAASVQRAAGHA